MGLLKTTLQTAGGLLADQWQKVIEPASTNDGVIIARGVEARANGWRSDDATIIANGSVAHVYPNQLMLLLDGGKIADYTAEEGYYTIDQSASPSFFNGQREAVLKDAFDRFRFAGVPYQKQQVYYINLAEIKGIKFGTRTPINYFDSFYNAELRLRAHGVYSLRITDPFLFFAQMPLGDKETLTVDDLNEQLSAEFLEALQTAISQLSADGERISFITAKSRLLSQYLSETLDSLWQSRFGAVIESVALSSLSYDERSQELLDMRNQGAMLSDSAISRGYLQGAAARGLEAAGNNAAGSATGFMGVNMAMNMSGNLFAQSQSAAPTPASAPAAGGWQCACGAVSGGNFCPNCGAAKPTGGFCPNCGAKTSGGNFCSACGQRLNGQG